MTFTKRKVAFISAAVILVFFALASSLGLFSPDTGYIVVPHGNHNHYIPHDRDPDMPIHTFPQRPPREGELITPDGRIIRDSTVVAPN